MCGCQSNTFIILLFTTFNRSTNEPAKNRVDDKIELNFYFHTSFIFHKTFWGTTKKCENKNLKPKIELTATKFSPGRRFVSPVTKSQYISDPINISIEHSGDILVSANFNALIKSRFFSSCFTLWPLMFGHIFGTHKHLINLPLELPISFTFPHIPSVSLLPLFYLKNN